MNLNLYDWLSSNDTGVSSIQIARRFLRLPLTEPWGGIPFDADDFGRCYRLLKKVPEINIECMKGFNRIWDGLVDKWSELTIMYEAKDFEGIWETIKEIEKPFWKNNIQYQNQVLYGEYTVKEEK